MVVQILPSGFEAIADAITSIGQQRRLRNLREQDRTEALRQAILRDRGALDRIGINREMALTEGNLTSAQLATTGGSPEEIEAARMLPLESLQQSLGGAFSLEELQGPLFNPSLESQVSMQLQATPGFVGGEVTRALVGQEEAIEVGRAQTGEARFQQTLGREVREAEGAQRLKEIRILGDVEIQTRFRQFATAQATASAEERRLAFREEFNIPETEEIARLSGLETQLETDELTRTGLEGTRDFLAEAVAAGDDEMLRLFSLATTPAGRVIIDQMRFLENLTTQQQANAIRIAETDIDRVAGLLSVRKSLREDRDLLLTRLFELGKAEKFEGQDINEENRRRLIQINLNELQSLNTLGQRAFLDAGISVAVPRLEEGAFEAVIDDVLGSTQLLAEQIEEKIAASDDPLAFVTASEGFKTLPLPQQNEILGMVAARLGFELEAPMEFAQPTAPIIDPLSPLRPPGLIGLETPIPLSAEQEAARGQIQVREQQIQILERSAESLPPEAAEMRAQLLQRISALRDEVRQLLPQAAATVGGA